MKNLLVFLFLSSALISCNECLECKYSTLKGTEVEEFCSSTKQDRVDFEQYMDSLASSKGSKAICTKGKY